MGNSDLLAAGNDMNEVGGHCLCPLVMLLDPVGQGQNAKPRSGSAVDQLIT